WQQPSPQPVRHFRPIPLTRTMRGTPNIADAHIPDPVLELPDLAHIDPAPVFTDLDLVMGTDFDLIAPFLNGVDGTGTEHPFPDPFALIGPHGDADLSLPVIDDFQQPTGFIAIVFWWPGAQLSGEWRPPLRQLYLHLGQSEQRGEEQEH